ncbi:900_t:CDS:2 [Entrophospora sp. SA101]|nr:900_t:CDS:2 [Entrophospora sp. SA101]
MYGNFKNSYFHDHCEVNETDRNNYLERECYDIDNNSGNNTNENEDDDNNSQKLVRKNTNQKKHNLRSSSKFDSDKRVKK